MFQAIIDIEFCYGHRLVGHLGKCRHLHGHSGLLTLTFQSEKLTEGNEDMVIDFSVAKQKAKTWVDAHLDHTLLLHCHDPIVPLLAQCQERFLTLPERPTAEVIARYSFDQLTQLGLPIWKICLHESAHTRAVYIPI